MTNKQEAIRDVILIVFGILVFTAYILWMKYDYHKGVDVQQKGHHGLQESDSH